MHNFSTFPALSSQTPPSASAELALTLLGPSTEMSQLWAQVRRLAPYVRTVLLTGAPDAGQEAVARLLLNLSPLPGRPFLALGETAAEDRLARAGVLSLLPNELFLFLPEVERLSPAAQDGLLRVLRMRRSRSFSVVAATQQDLRVLVSMGRFSAELAEALSPVRIALPALAQRLEDLPMLVSQMLAQRCQALNQPVPSVSEELLRAAMEYSWPANLGELAAAVDAMLGKSNAEGSTELRAADLQRALREARAVKPEAQPVRMMKLDDVIHEHIFAVLKACRGNKLRAAEVLGISRSTLYRMLENAAQNTSMPLAS